MAGLTFEFDAAGSAIGGGNPDGTAYALSEANGYAILGYEAPEPEEEIQWASSADTEGERRASSRPRNRTVTIRVRLTKSTDALVEAEFNALGKKIGKMRREGGTLKVTHPSGTVGYFDVQAAGHAFPWDHRLVRVKRGEVSIALTCDPYIRGAEVDLGDNTETTLPALVFTEATIAGDVPALGRLVIDDDSGVNQWWMTWGVQSRYYSSSANAALFYEAEGRTALGGSATAAGPSGASGGGSNVMRNTALTTSYLGVLSTQATGGGAHLSHVGTFRVYARIQTPTTNSGDVTVALEWSEADFLRSTTNAATTIPTAQEGVWLLVDLGLVSLTAVTSGTQRWEGRIVAKSTTNGDDIDVDYLMLIPVSEGSGIVSGVQRVPAPTSYSAEDHFTSTTAGNALNTRVAPTGGTWATSGDATDFLFVDPYVAAATEAVIRSASTSTNGRFAILGSTNYTAKVVQATISRDGGPGVGHELRLGLIARWTDSSNFLKAYVSDTTNTPSDDSMVIMQVVGGVSTTIASVGIELAFAAPWPISAQQPLRLTVTANGIATLELFNAAGTAVVESCSGYSSALATGGTLATGKPGLWDFSTSSSHGRVYDDFYVWVPPIDAAVFASQSIEIRSDRVQREDSGGTLFAKPSSYTGDHLLVPASGAEARTARVIVKATRNDPTVVDPSIDDISARLFVTPRFLAMPD